EFVTELNDDYSLKRHVVNIYREGNLGKDKTGMPVRVGEKLKVINYSDNMDDFYTAIRRTGKDGLTMAGLDKKIYDDKGNLLFYSSGDTLYAPQARDKYPSIARKTNDGYIVNEDSETEHANKEALFGYMLSELKKHCELKVDYEVEGAVDGSIGDRKTLIDARHFDPPLYVQARISEQTEALLETSDVKTTLSNYVRKSSQIANELLQRVEQLTLEATPYTIKLATNNGIVFKNNRGQSTIYPSLKRGQKPVECTWKWLVDNQGFGTSPTFEVQAAGMSSKLVLTAIALIDGKEVAREQVTFTNVNDGAKGSDGKSITVAKAEKQADGVKVTFSDNKSIVVPKGDKGDKGDPADPVPLNALQEEMKQTKQGLSDVKTDLLKEKAESSANIERVKKEVGAISSQQTAYEQSNTENLARITGQLGDKASKSEIKQTADGIREEMSQLSKNADEKISAAKTTFEKTAEGLKTDMVAVKSYVANDGKRREELEQYSREETAKQIASERSAVAQNYVGKSQYTEDVKGVNRRFEELRTGTSNLLLNTEFKTLADVNNVNGATLKLNQNDYNSHNSIEVTVTGQNKNVWKGITLNASVSAFKKGDTIAVRMPIYIFSDVPINAGLTLVLKNRSKNIAYVFKGLGGLPRNKWHIVEFLHTFNSDTNFEGVNFFHLYATQNGHYKIAEPSLTLSNVIPSSWAPAVEDSKNYTDTKLAEYKQGVDGQFAAVKQEVGSKVSQATFDQRANQITQSVQELNNNTVKKNQIKIDENGLVSSSEKIVNGQTLASMISQNPEWVEIIAKLLKVKADMIVNGAVTADKLNVEKLSALTSDLGNVTAGLIDLRKHWVRTSTDDVWGIIDDVTYDTSTLLSDDGILTNGRPGRNKKSDVKPTIMPLVWLNSGQLFFANVDSEYDIIQMLLNGVYPFVRGNTAQIRFGKLEDEREALFIDCQFAELYLKANNYTDWKQSTFNSGVRWKVQGNLILVDYDVTFNKDGNQAICGVPQEYVAGARMFVVKAWSLNKDKDRTAQLNADGSLHILGAEKGMNYRGQIIWAY
ncbi:hypothetical protein OJ594_05405, partial [Streptococcus anginosus]|nr:hypothetical protein [Streptococcus anginosus]